MLKKLLFALLIVCISYILIVFKFPELADKIEGFFGISINETIRMKKQEVQDFSTTLPDKYSPVLSGAIETKDKVVEGVYDAKEKIDDIRVTLSGAEDTFNKAKETVNDINEIKTEIEGFIQTGSKILNSTGTTD